MHKIAKPHIVDKISDVIEDMCEAKDRFTIKDISEAIYEGVFAEYEKDLLVTFVVSKKQYDEKVV